jgi:predicted ABC-type ATPase
MKNKIAYIVRGLPGAGKSTLAESLTDHVCEADKFMVDKEGNYKFNPARLAYCHDKCFKLFKRLLESGVDSVAVANTSTAEWEFENYMQEAETHGYTVVTLIVENRHGSSSVHNVPQAAVDNMERKLRKNIKLK